MIKNMKAWLRFITVVLVALALPVQGMASLAMMNCGPASDRVHTVTAIADLDAPGGHVHGAVDASDVDGHEAPGMADDAVPADAQPQDQTADPGQHRCSACASCCSGYAILSTILRVLTPEPIAVLFVAVVPAVVPFATDGPDRPPRHERA